MEEDAQKSDPQSEAGNKNSKWEQEMGIGEHDQNSLKTEEAKHEKKGPYETLYSLTDTADDEHETRTCNVVVGEKSEPMTYGLGIIFNLRETLSNQKVRNDVIGWKKEFHEKGLSKVIEIEILLVVL